MDKNRIRLINIEKLCSGNELYIFGAGVFAKSFLLYLGEENRSLVKKILVSNPAGNPHELMGVEVAGIDSVEDATNGIIIVAVLDNKVIVEEMRRLGFSAVYPIQKIMPIYDDFASVIARDREVRRYIEGFEEKKTLFNYVDIETHNRCNGGCKFCPMNRFEDQREYSRMSEEMFKMIIDELSELGFSGSIGLNANNEPFMDNRIVGFAQYTRKKLPDALIYIVTNGTLLTLDKFVEIEPFIDYLQVDNYLSDYVPDNIASIFDESTVRGVSDKVVYYEFTEDMERSSRAGESPNSKVFYTEEVLCPLPFTDFYIRSDGNVGLCCNDALGHTIVGNVEEQSLSDIWFGEKMRRIREAVKEGRYYQDNCRYCNYIDMRELWEKGVYFSDKAFSRDNNRTFFPNSILKSDKLYIFGHSKDCRNLYRYLRKLGNSIEAFLENDPLLMGLEVIENRTIQLLTDVTEQYEIGKMGFYIMGYNATSIFHELTELGVASDDIRIVFPR